MNIKEYRIFGPPGTGKTTWLAKQIENATEKYGDDNVMVASFTKAAAFELNSRNLPIPRDNIGTLHSLCYRAMGKPDIAETKVEDFNKNNPAYTMSVSSLNRMDEMYVDQTFQTEGDRLLNQLNIHRARCLPIEAMSQTLRGFYKAWEVWKMRNNLIDFTDMIAFAAQAKDPPPGSPRIGIYDECQDFNKLQFNLIRHWAKFQEFILIAGDDDQCHPAGTMIRTKNRGNVPIEDLNESKDVLWSFDQHGQDFYRAKSWRISSRQFKGNIITINNHLPVTYNHRMIVRWKQNARGAKAVYLMRKGDYWRIGITDLIRKKAAGVFGIGQRARQEQADEAWILCVFDDPTEATRMEELLSIRYSISRMCFVAPKSGAKLNLSQEQLDQHHAIITGIARPYDLLDDALLRPEFPFWKKDGRQRGITAWQEVRACNLINKYMEIPEFTGSHTAKKFTTINTLNIEHKACTVYSLEVLPLETYVANGIVVHNSIYSFTGASPDAFLTPDVPQEQKRILGQSWRLPKKIQEYAMRWIRQIKHREEKEFKPRDEEGDVQHIQCNINDPRRIIDIAGKYAVKDKSVMILTSCGFMLDPLKKNLREQGIPFHNPFRRNRADWNPLGSFGQQRKGTISTKERFLAFLRMDTNNPYWTPEDFAKWIDIVKIRDVFRKGGKARYDGFVESTMAAFPGTTRDFLYDILNDYSFDRAVNRDTNWFYNALLADKKRTIEYPMMVFNKQGIKALAEKPKIMIGTIHCSPGDERILTTEGWIQMQDLDPSKHRLASYMSKCNRLAWGGCNSSNGLPRKEMGYPFIIAKNPYNGEMITLRSDSSSTRVTPTHRLPVKFSDHFFEKWVVYLMKRGDWWRVGICVSGHRPYKSGGIAGRLATEQADSAWILKVCDSREDAIYHESIIQGQFGIPGLTFEAAKNRSLSSEILHKIHDATQESVNRRIDELCSHFGILKDCPLWTRQNEKVQKRNMRGMFLTTASNVLNQYMEILTVDEGFVDSKYNLKFNKKPIWKLVSVTKEHFEGSVYSLEVLPYHHYISGNAVVHNSVKGGEADVVILFPDISRQGVEELHRDPDPTIRQFYVGMTRARETLLLGQPATGMTVRFHG